MGEKIESLRDVYKRQARRLMEEETSETIPADLLKAQWDFLMLKGDRK